MVRADEAHGYYLLPEKPNNPLKLSTIIIRAGPPREYYEVRDAVINYEPGTGWVLILPIIRDEIELLYLE